MIYYLCPDDDTPSGGIKMIYRHVDILNRNNISANVLHQREGFRCAWFLNDTGISYLEKTRIHASDFLVVPEIYGPGITKIGSNVRKVIFNQNCYNTFLHYSIDPTNKTTPYRQNDVIAVLVVSEDNKQYLEYVYPELKVIRLHYGINPDLFSYYSEKKKQICFMPRKHVNEAVQVINILKFRDVLDDFTIIPIEHKSEEEVGDIFKDSLLFLSFGYPEGFGLPPAEAMACGCIAVGYHGMGGKEFFKSEFAYPIEQGNIISFANTVEQLLKEYQLNPDTLIAQGKMASDFILQTYSIEREEEDIIGCWSQMIKDRLNISNLF